MLKQTNFSWIYVSIFLGVLFPVSHLCAYSVKNLRGIIIDENTGKPLANTEILIQGASVEEAIQVFTNESGVFEVEISAGIYKMCIKNSRYYVAEIFKSIPFDEQTEIQMTISLHRMVVGQVVALKGIRFALNDVRFHVHSRDLEDVWHLLRTNPNLIIEISCHTDSRGDDQYNMKLSQQRAESLVKYLIARGIPENQLVARGYGETFPLNHCSNEVRCSGREHTQNRRVEYLVVGFIDDKPE